MTIQGQAIRVASGTAEATHLPEEIAFLVRHGVRTEVLREAARIASKVGVTADEAAIKCEFLDEVTFYRALAYELNVPFLAEVRADERVRYPDSILAGLAPLQPSSSGSRYAMAPTGEALLRLLGGRPRLGGGFAITTPSALLRGVLNARPRAIAWHAACDLPDLRPEWSYRDGISWPQVSWAAALSGSLSGAMILAPALTVSIIMAVVGVVFLCMVTLRLAATREAIPTQPVQRSGRYDDQDLPVYTVIVALYRERRVLARLVEALASFDYPVLCSKCTIAGYRVADLPSATLEEAPAHFKAWMKQRTRWMKGFMQVCVTHSRRPVRGWRSLGPARFFGAVTMTFGTVLAALGYPFFTVFSVRGLVDQTLFRAETPLEVMSSVLGIILFVSGLVAIIVPALAALRRRGWWGLLPYVPLLPLYYVLISVAAWRGLLELLLDPFRWNKTEHGLAQTSRAGMLTPVEEAPEPPLPGTGRD